jgi:hypothetical protein
MTSHLIFCLLLATLAASGQETNLLLALEPVAPFLELRVAAIADGIPIDGFAPPASTNTLSPGDSVTALITLHGKGDHRTEWLVYFQVVLATNDSLAKPPKPEVVYNSTGDKFEFAKSPVKLHIRTLGPYLDAESIWGKPVAKGCDARASVNGTFLGLGLDKGAAVINRLCRASATNFNFGVAERPPSNKEAQENQKIAAVFHVSPEEKRALASWLPTLMCYLQAVCETPDLDTIMWKVVSLPSMWSVLRHVGVTTWVSIDFDNINDEQPNPPFFVVINNPDKLKIPAVVNFSVLDRPPN